MRAPARLDDVASRRADRLGGWVGERVFEARPETREKDWTLLRLLACGGAPTRTLEKGSAQPETRSRSTTGEYA